MCTLQRRPGHGLRRQGRLRPRQGHPVVLLLDGRQAWRGWLSASKLRLLLFAALGRCHDLACPGLIRGVVEERADIVNKERIEQLSNLLLVGKIKGALKRDPEFL